MSKYATYKQLNLPAIDEEILSFWKDNQVFEKSISEKDPTNTFVFYEGPPSANGMPGIHHVMARSVKDIFCRFQSMKGKRVNRKAGWDTHGLPVELSVEKALGITKEDIGTKISIEEYNQKCRETVMKYTSVWDELTQKMGYWVDMQDPYITYSPKYMESVWWLLQQIYNKGLLYKGYTIQPYSPKAGTGLSSHELNQPGCYKDVTDTTIVAQFKAIKSTLPSKLQSIDGEVYFLAWTTTPWTLPSNTALTVGPKIEYSVVQTFNQYTYQRINVVLASALVGKQFKGKYELTDSLDTLNNFDATAKKIPYIVVDTLMGIDLVESTYEQLLPFTLPYETPELAFRVISGDFVTTEDGTGIVHTAPTFGADDAFVARNAQPPVPPMLVKDENDNLVPLVNLQGKFRPEMGHLAGKYVKSEYYDEGREPEKSVDVEIAIQLKEENKAFLVEKYVHNYPHCWRTDKPVLYYPLDSWFIKISDVKERMFQLNKTINWKPESTGTGRFGNWLQNANDWNLSRSRYWGIPLPIWRTEDGKEEIIIGSVDELKAEIQRSIKAGLMDSDIFQDFEVGNMSDNNYEKIDLHKNVVDQIVLLSPTGKPMKRESDLIDVWFDSGAMPYAQWHYPFENKAQFDQVFPADFIAEGVDQTRGWFYTLHAIATLTQDNVAYKNVVSNGLVLDKNGKKMSKRLGNAIDPFETINSHGADATRWYMITNAQPWDNLKFDIEGIDEVKRKFFGTLYNTYSFFALYANIDGFHYEDDDIPLKDRPEIDQWILSCLNTLIASVEKDFAAYEPTNAGRSIQQFVEDQLSNWYVRLCRRRFWKGEYSDDKKAAYQTLYTCMTTVAKLMSPIAPFFADFLFRNLNMVTKKEKHISVHLTDFPSYLGTQVDSALEERMSYAQRISSLILSLRKKESIRVRQPLQKIMIPVLHDSFQSKVELVQDLILAEVNVKELIFLDDTSGVIKKKIKPNFKTLGKRLGGDMKDASQLIASLSQDEIQTIERTNQFLLKIGENQYELSLEDFEIISEDIPGWLVANDDALTVALDITISDTLKEEGIARELVNRIQNIRKDNNFDVTDRITIKVSENEIIKAAIASFGQYICDETLANSIQLDKSIAGNTVEIFEDLSIDIEVEKI